MLASTLPAIPEPFPLLFFVGSVVGAVLAIGAVAACEAGRIGKVAASGLLVAGFAAFAMLLGMAIAQRNDHREELLTAIEEHWQVTHVSGSLLSESTGWVGEVDGEHKQCHTFNDDHLVVVCDGQEPAVRR